MILSFQTPHYATYTDLAVQYIHSPSRPLHSACLLCLSVCLSACWVPARPRQYVLTLHRQAGVQCRCGLGAGCGRAAAAVVGRLRRAALSASVQILPQPNLTLGTGKGDAVSALSCPDLFCCTGAVYKETKPTHTLPQFLRLVFEVLSKVARKALVSTLVSPRSAIFQPVNARAQSRGIANQLTVPDTNEPQNRVVQSRDLSPSRTSISSPSLALARSRDSRGLHADN
ncbi:hypothetical protein B0T26DRAFT_272761 [Lasiosphaeria miniovina]|uniref:Uncharacterized protein n=1 Tax=Lasiosphaeria miniovina TaxID=1954250 RepID=A0AA40DX89_9PEZI|nr:uncharacterized protein B0T26DRAFT_272761 [Lasiosphaeria miniovina]KAK0716977.1 hypothetical protein B0T26DRAFT_272761 [Lasiosphaeria miniovina]